MANKFYRTNSKSRLLLQIDTLLDRTACLLSLGGRAYSRYMEEGLALLRMRTEYYYLEINGL